MQVINSLEKFPPEAKGGALCIGNFDGVHIGHKKLLAETVRSAESVHGPTVVLTLHPHPLRITNPGKMPEPISRMQEKLQWLEQAGVDIVVVEPSRPEIFQLTPEEFLDQLILQYVHPKWIVEGQSFRFGRDRAGDINTLRRMGQDHGFQVLPVPPVKCDLGPDGKFTVSSSLIRELIAGGLVAQAAACLGRPHLVTGVVARGAGRGRQLGFPTANLEQIAQLTPAEGVYAGRTWVLGRCYPSPISVGRAVTFDHGERLVEAVLLGFNQDIYDQDIQVEFYLHLRQQLRFPTPESLARQIKADCEKVQSLVAAGRIEIPHTEKP